MQRLGNDAVRRAIRVDYPIREFIVPTQADDAPVRPLPAEPFCFAIPQWLQEQLSGIWGSGYNYRTFEEDEIYRAIAQLVAETFGLQQQGLMSRLATRMKTLNVLRCDMLEKAIRDMTKAAAVAHARNTSCPCGQKHFVQLEIILLYLSAVHIFRLPPCDRSEETHRLINELNLLRYIPTAISAYNVVCTTNDQMVRCVEKSFVIFGPEPEHPMSAEDVRERLGICYDYEEPTESDTEFHATLGSLASMRDRHGMYQKGREIFGTQTWDTEIFPLVERLAWSIWHKELQPRWPFEPPPEVQAAIDAIQKARGVWGWDGSNGKNESIEKMTSAWCALAQSVGRTQRDHRDFIMLAMRRLKPTPGATLTGTWWVDHTEDCLWAVIAYVAGPRWAMLRLGSSVGGLRVLESLTGELFAMRSWIDRGTP